MACSGARRMIKSTEKQPTHTWLDWFGERRRWGRERVTSGESVLTALLIGRYRGGGLVNLFGLTLCCLPCQFNKRICRGTQRGGGKQQAGQGGIDIHHHHDPPPPPGPPPIFFFFSNSSSWACFLPPAVLEYYTLFSHDTFHFVSFLYKTTFLFAVVVN